MQLKEGKRAVVQLTGIACDIRVLQLMTQLYQCYAPIDAIDAPKYTSIMLHDVIAYDKLPFQLRDGN